MIPFQSIAAGSIGSYLFAVSLAYANPASSPLNPMNQFLLNFPSNYSVYGLTSRAQDFPSGSFGGQVFCDRNEVAVGAFCQRISDDDSTEQNTLLSGGVVPPRSAVCQWKFSGHYYVIATCLAIRPIVGDSTFAPVPDLTSGPIRVPNQP